MAKKISNESLLGQRGMNFIEQCVLGMGFAWHPSHQAVEAGIDGYIELRNPDSEEALNPVVAVQSEARSEFVAESADSFTFYCEPRDIEYWLQANLPVIVVVSRPDTETARARLFAIARPRESGLYLAPLPKSELLYPNLLKSSARVPTGPVGTPGSSYEPLPST